MKRSIRNMIVLLLAAVYIGIGYLRDFLFVNINFALDKLQSDKEFQGHSFLEFLKNLDASTLVTSKYLLTGVFTLLNFLPGAFIIYLLFRYRIYVRWYASLYGTTLFIALLFFGGGHLLGFGHHGYSLSRLFMGFLQSPVPAMIFLPLCWLHQREREEK
ncbi:MAG: hypothetical protein ABEH38_07850 [Flavobacteriales bacterium]